MSVLVQFLGDASSIIGGAAQSACGSSCGSSDLGKIFGMIANALIFVIGAISVIMIIVGGLRFVTSNGDAKAATAGRETVLYAVIGLIVAIASYAIVNFVVKNVK